MRPPTALALDTFEALAAPFSVPLEIERFLSGETEGELLLGLLYDHVLDEPVPERLSAICRLS